MNTLLDMIKENTKELDDFMSEMTEQGIKLKLVGNVPWIYLDEINGVRVTETGNQGNHGFTIAWYPTEIDGKYKLVEDMDSVRELIKKYTNKDEEDN